MNFGIDPDAMYATSDPALAILGAPQTLANQRSRGLGAPYYRHGGKILYRGADVIEFLESKRVEPEA